MAYHRSALVFSWLILLVATQPQTPVITKTVRSTCMRRVTSLTLPLEGWISTNGTKSPYTFGPSAASFATGTILPVTEDLSLSTSAAQTSNLPDGPVASTSQILPGGLSTAASLVADTILPATGGSSLSTPASQTSDAPGGTLSSTRGLSTAAPSTASLAAITRITGGTITSIILGGTTLTQSASGRVTTIVTGGLTTSYTTGGTTQTIYGISEPTSTSISVPDAVIGPCPAYNGRVFEDENGVAFLVACGSTYDGSVLSTYNRRSSQNRPLQIRATSDDCTSQCTALIECVAASYSGSVCTFYKSIVGQLLSAIPAFSAARLVLDTVEPANTTSNSVPVQASSSMALQPTNSEALMTTTELIFSISSLLSTLPPSTITTTLLASTVTISTVAPGQTTTALLTTTLPGSIATIIFPASTITSPVTLTQTSLKISTIFNTLAAETITKPGETIISTLISVLPASSFTTTITSIVSASAIVVTTSLPGQTTTAIYTTALPASTTTLTTVSTRDASTSTYYVTATQTAPTETLQPSVITQTILIPTTIVLPAQTISIRTTLVSTEVAPTNILVSTVFKTAISTEVSTQIPPTETLISTAFQTSISTEVSTYLSTYWQTVTATTSLAAETQTLEAPTSIMISIFITSYPVTITATSTQLVTITNVQDIIQSITLPASTEISFQDVTVVSSYPVVTTAILTQLVTFTSLQDVTLPAVTELSLQDITVVSTYITTDISSYWETTTLQASTVISTQQTTIVSTQPAETSLVPTTVISTQQTTIVSTQPAETSLVPTTVISTQQTTIISTQPPTTVVVTQVTTVTSTPPAVTVYYQYSVPQPTCLSGNDGKPYTASDGSQYMVLCGRDNAGANIFGITVNATGYSDCIGYCSSQGTTCMGITWQASGLKCLLKQTMISTAAGGSGSLNIDSAIRLSGPGGINATTNLVANSGFDTGGLDSWSFGSTTGWSSSVVNNTAVFTLQTLYSQLYFQQAIVANAGDEYFLTYTYTIAGYVDPGTHSGYGYFGVLLSSNGYTGYTNIVGNTIKTTMYASGVVSSTTSPIEFYCYGTESTGMSIILDDFAFYTYPKSAGLNPIQPMPVTIYGPTQYSSKSGATSTAALGPIDVGRSYTLTADLAVVVSSSSSSITTCTLSLTFSDGGPFAFYSQQIASLSFTASQIQTLRVQDVIRQIAAQSMNIGYTCTNGNPSSNSVSLANLTVVLNP